MSLLDGSLASGASGVRINSGSTLKPNITFGATGNEYTMTTQTGLSDHAGKYEFSASSSELTVKFTDKATSNVTHTKIDLTTALSGNAAPGGAFTLDLSAAGYGTLPLTADSANTAVDGASVAAALNGLTTTTSSIYGDGKTRTYLQPNCNRHGGFIDTVYPFGTAVNQYQMTSAKWLPSQRATFRFTTAGTQLTVKCDVDRREVSNMTMEISSVLSGDMTPGGTFKLDLSAAGLGVLTIKADSGNTSVTAASIADALNTNIIQIVSDESSGGTPYAVGLSPTYGSVVSNAYFAGEEQPYATDANTSYPTAPPGEYTLEVRANSERSYSISISETTQGHVGGVVASSYIPIIFNGSDCYISLELDNFNNLIYGNLGVIHFDASNANTTDIANWLNGMKIIVPEREVSDGKGGLKIQVGANEGEQLSISVEKMNIDGLGLTASSIAD